QIVTSNQISIDFASSYAILFSTVRFRDGQHGQCAIHSQACGSASADAESATRTPVFIDDGHPFMGRFHDGFENAGLVNGFDTAGRGGGSRSVMPRLIAKRVTAVSSVIADTGSTCQA